MSDNKKWFEKIDFFQKLKNIKHIEIFVAVIFAVVIFMIYLSTTGSKSLLSSSSNKNQTSFESRLSDILSDIDGAGNVTVFVHSEEDKIVGIIVVASGADNVGVRLNILKAIQTVLSSPTPNI